MAVWRESQSDCEAWKEEVILSICFEARQAILRLLVLICLVPLDNAKA